MSNEFVTPSGQGRKYDCAPNWQTLFLAPTKTAPTYDVVEDHMGYLGGPPLHIHPQQDETHYVLQGQLRYQIGEQIIDANTGDCIHIPAGTAHAWINLHPEPARILGILSPGGAEGFFQTVASSTPALDADALVKLGQVYGTDVIGPPLAASMSPVQPSFDRP